MKSMSKHHIVIPPPKVELPDKFRTEDKIRDYVDGHLHITALKGKLTGQFDWPYHHNIKVAWKQDLYEMSRWWRIERSRADHLEEIVEGLQREVDDLRGRNGIFRRLFPRRPRNG